MTGTELIAKERQRQIEEEGWDTQCQLPLNKFKGLEGSGSQPRTERPNS